MCQLFQPFVGGTSEGMEKDNSRNAYPIMRLLESDGNGGFRLTRDYINNIPPFAILSHTCGPVTDEATFPDLVEKKRFVETRIPEDPVLWKAICQACLLSGSLLPGSSIL